MGIFRQVRLALLRVIFESFQVVLVCVVIQGSHITLASEDFNLLLLFALWRQHAVDYILDVAIVLVILRPLSLYLSPFHVC